MEKKEEVKKENNTMSFVEHRLTPWDEREIRRLKKLSPMAYIKHCGGFHRALENFKMLKGQSKDGYTSPKWEEIGRLASKGVEKCSAS